MECSLVLTTNGPILGKLNCNEGVFFYSYENIPYAENPIGPLRFGPPIPKRSWIKPLNATKEGPVCPQPEGKYKKWQMTEDCLILNIFVPANRTQSYLPVYVNLHGGGFKSISGNRDVIYGPQFFIQQEVILITLNYRLGALGFLSLEVDEASGNAGIKDVILALKWIKKNIEKFRGQKSNITVGGQSSGAALVHYLLLTEKTTNLFNKALLVSGSANNMRFFEKHPKKNAIALANQLGLPTDNVTALLKTLRNIDPFDIVDAQENIYKDTRNIMRPFAPFVPCLEKKQPLAVITEDPEDIMKSGTPQNVPLFVGFNAEEGIYQYNVLQKNQTAIDNLSKIYPGYILSDIKYPRESTVYKDLVNSLNIFYFGDENLSNFTVNNFINVLSDTQYIFPIDAWIKLHKARADSKPLYYYVFNFDGELNWAKLNYNIDMPGTAHSDELGYIFVTQITKPLLDRLESRTKNMLDIMTNLVTNFVKFGNPTQNYSDVDWPDCGPLRKHLLLSDNPIRRNFAPEKERLNFWYNVYEEYRQYIENGGKLEIDE
ncbi:juvenile hormone esterase [Aphomia sociella]